MTPSPSRSKSRFLGAFLADFARIVYLKRHDPWMIIPRVMTGSIAVRAADDVQAF